MAKVGLSAPWINYYREIEAMFKDDPEVKILYDEDANEIRLYVDNTIKADALSELLPVEKTFGAVTIRTTIIPSNTAVSNSRVNLIEAAFKGNPALSYVQTIHGLFTNDLNYVVFKNKVVQYFNDDLSDVNGFKSTLYQDIAKDIFGEQENVFFCTDVPNASGVSLGKPLGEWP